MDYQSNQYMSSSSSSSFPLESSIQSHQSYSSEAESVHNLGVVEKHLCPNSSTNEQGTDLYKDCFLPYARDSIQVENQIYLEDQNHLSSEYLAFKKQKIKDMSSHTDVYVEKDNNISCQPLDNLSVLKKNINDSFHPMNSSNLKEGDGRSCYPNMSMFPLSSDQLFNSAYDLSLLDKNSSMHPKNALHNYSLGSSSNSNAAISTYPATDLFSQKNHQQISEMFPPNNFTSKCCLSYSNTNYPCFPLHPDTFYNDGSSGTRFPMPMKTSVDPSDFADSTAISQIKFGQDRTPRKAKEGFLKNTN